MDAVKLVAEQSRMCEAMKGCMNCPCDGICIRHVDSTWSIQQIEKAVQIIEKWAKEHPPKTRLSKLKEQYPKMKTDNFHEELCCECLGYDCPDCDGISCESCWNKSVDE